MKKGVGEEIVMAWKVAVSYFVHYLRYFLSFAFVYSFRIASSALPTPRGDTDMGRKARLKTFIARYYCLLR